MAHETSKSLRRRFRDPNFATLYFRGRAIDIGCGADSLAKQQAHWPLLVSVDNWDLGDGDAQTLPGVKPNTYDLVYSSHCLEHLRTPVIALGRWWDVTKPGGFLVFTVPDFEMYERGHWPSRFNPDHKSRWTLCGIADLLDGTGLGDDVIKIERIIEGFDPSLPDTVDQTFDGNAECAIECIVRKPQ